MAAQDIGCFFLFYSQRQVVPARSSLRADGRSDVDFFHAAVLPMVLKALRFCLYLLFHPFALYQCLVVVASKSKA